VTRRILTAPFVLLALLGGLALVLLFGLGALIGWALEGRRHA
jgi:Sec-independent protein secretion pathway component TatC